MRIHSGLEDGSISPPWDSPPAIPVPLHFSQAVVIADQKARRQVRAFLPKGGQYTSVSMEEAR